MALINPFPYAPWFSIDEDQYLMYLLKGYEIITLHKAILFRLNGQWHRDDGPAIMLEDETLNQWWVNDQLMKKDK